MFELPPQDVPPSEASARLSAAVPVLAALPNVVLVGYPVSGRSQLNIRTEMNERRPELNGERHDAATVWSHRTRWRNGPDGQCRPDTAEVIVEITVTLPDLENPARLDRDELVVWRRYLAVLETHEGNHARIANHGAERMQAAMRAAPSCEAMRTAAQEVGDSIAIASDEYDRRTGHGVAEGAVLTGRTFRAAGSPRPRPCR